MKQLKDLQVGDYVSLIHYNYGYRTLRKIERVTKTLIEVDSLKFSRGTGKYKGKSQLCHFRICVPTEEEMKVMEEKEFRNKMVYIVRSYDFVDLPIEKLKQIYCIIKSENDKN